MVYLFECARNSRRASDSEASRMCNSVQTEFEPASGKPAPGGPGLPIWNLSVCYPNR
jgi:hypothetical protein